MAGSMPAIRSTFAAHKNADARHKAGHDERSVGLPSIGDGLGSPHELAEAICRAGPRASYIFTPLSAKYFKAPGCHGIGEFR